MARWRALSSVSLIGVDTPGSPFRGFYADRTFLQFTTLDGRVLSRVPLHLQKGLNQVVFNHGYGAAGIIICSLLVDGLPVQSTKMIFHGM